jgi:CRISPR-associated protein Csy3
MNLCTHLNYQRSLSPSKAVFFYKTANSDFEPLQAEINHIQGQKSSYTEAYGSKNSPKNLQPQDLAYCNPVTIETCYVPPTVSEHYCRFSLRVEANSLQPMICSDQEVHQLLSDLAEAYKQVGGYKQLAERYTKNILSGSWLWRNQHAKAIQIELLTANDKNYVIKDATQLVKGIWTKEDLKVLDDIAEDMEKALTDPSVYWFADVTAKISTSFCQEITPSQAFVDVKVQGEASKQYTKVMLPDGRNAVSFNAEKIGAAIQSIDDWWEEGAEKQLRVHEYGADRRFIIAQRHPSKGNDFYSLIKRTEEFVTVLASLTKKYPIPDDIHYVMAVLVKAGMFQKGKS